MIAYVYESVQRSSIFHKFIIVKVAAKNLYKKLTEEKEQLMIVDWYKDDQPVALVKDAIQKSLDQDLPECYDKESFASKISLLLNHFIDMSIQGYGWVGA